LAAASETGSAAGDVRRKAIDLTRFECGLARPAVAAPLACDRGTGALVEF
jgi:hypothetical protein